MVGAKLKTLMKEVEEESNGYKRGEPWRMDEKTLTVVIPIQRNGEIERDYVTQPEVAEDVKAKDTGDIDKVAVNSHADKDVFIRVGSIFEADGKDTQERGLTASIIVEKGSEEIVVPVRCVHGSQPIQRGMPLKIKRTAPMSVTQSLMFGSQGDVWSTTSNFIGMVTGGGGRRIRRTSRVNTGAPSVRSVQRSSSSRSYLSASQGHGHESVRHTGFKAAIEEKRDDSPELLHFDFDEFEDSSGHGTVALSGTGLGDDLAGTLDAIDKSKKGVDEVLQKVPLFENQVGVIIFDASGLLGIEMFEAPKSWEATREYVIKTYGDKTMKKQADAIFKLDESEIPKRVKEFFEKIAEMEEKEVAHQKRSVTWAMMNDGIVSEYTTLNDEVIHFLAMRTGS